MEKKEIRQQVRQSVDTQLKQEIQAMWKKVGAFVLTLMGLLILLLTFILMQRGMGSRDEPSGEAIKEFSLDEMSAQAEAAARGFLAAKTVPEMAQHVHDPRRVLPLMRDYYQTHPLDERELKELRKSRFHVASEREFIMSTAVFSDETSALWVFEKDDAGVMKLQWEVAVSYSEIDWDAFLSSKTTEPAKFRVTVEWTDYYNYQFSDEETYQSLLLRTPQSDTHVFGYIERDSDTFNEFMAVRTMSDVIAMPVIATLQFPEGGDGEQVLIVSIDSFSWVTGVEK